MSNINAQTIINEVLAAHAIAPDDGTEYITFKTSERGTHRIINDKAHLQRFADMVRKNAAAFGGGLIREAKTAPAVSYASKTISLYKQLIEDQDWHAALQLADEKLSPLFFFGTHGKAYMQVAPIPCDFEPRFVSTLSEDGRWAVIEPVSMLAFSGDSVRNKRSRDAQVEHVMQRYSRGTDEQKEAMFSKAYAKPMDKSAARAKWMADHGIIDDAAIEERIEQQAAQDVAEVVAQAVAVSAIAEAMAPAAESQPEPVAPVVGTEYDDTPCVGPFDIPACISVYDHEGHLVYSEDKDAPKVIDRIARLSPQEPAPTPDDTAKFNIRAKSGQWFACVYMIGTVYGLRFEAKGMEPITGEFATHKQRMQALEMMANALKTPPDGGMPIATVDAPTEAHTPPVAECTPGIPPMESRAKPEHDLQVGDVVRSSWGYDQTNVNHYQITKLIGKRTVEVRELVEHKESTGDMTGHVAPVWGEFKGEAMRRTVDRHGHVNILREKFGRASKIEPVAIVHGVRCYASTDYSSYA